MMSFGSSWTSLGTDHTPWYPDQRCFQRQTNQTWSDVLLHVAQQLLAYTEIWAATGIETGANNTSLDQSAGDKIKGSNDLSERLIS
jgi:hypothetical protein